MSYLNQELQPALVYKGCRDLDLNGPVGRPFEALTSDWADIPIIMSLRRIAAYHPGRTAIHDHGKSLSYRDLAEAVDRLAADIRRSPKRHGAVGLLLPNSFLSPVAALACLAAGRIFVPFDLNYPAPRIASLMQAAALDAVVIAGANGGERLPPDVARIDISACFEGPVPDLSDAAPLGPDSPAAILHTSGSSGRPKATGQSSEHLSGLLDEGGEVFDIPPCPFPPVL